MKDADVQAVVGVFIGSRVVGTIVSSILVFEARASG